MQLLTGIIVLPAAAVCLPVRFRLSRSTGGYLLALMIPNVWDVGNAVQSALHL